MSRKIALIRHGAYQQIEQAPSALQPYPLTIQGEIEVRQQARQLAAWLSEHAIQLDPIIDCSTLLRAWQTAEIYRQELAGFFKNTPVIESFSALCERSVGAVANLTVDEIERILELDPRFERPPANWKSSSDYCLPFDGAESLMDAGTRVANHIQHRMLGEHDDTLKLIIGHGASIRHAAYLLELMEKEQIRQLSMFYGHPVVFDFANQTSFSVPVFGKWKQRKLNEVPD
ncbi:histidine phosphatase family protein [Marinomonas epiphytica]